MNSRLSFLAVTRKWVNCYQFGFRPTHSASNAVLDLVENITESWRDCRVLSALTLVLEGAYDNALHPHLVQERLKLNFLADLLQISISFLSFRPFFTTDGDHNSDISHIQKGVPQESSLSSLLFALYMNTFMQKLQKIPGVLARAYANDIPLSTSSRSAEVNALKLENYMHDADDWASERGMTIPKQKTELMHFSREQAPTAMPHVNWGDIVIRSTIASTYFGAWLDPKLNWEQHVKCVVQKPYYRLSSLRNVCHIFWGVTLETMRKFYVGGVLPVLDYAAICCANITERRLFKLSKIQRRAALMISGALPTSSCAVLNVEGSLLPFPLHFPKRVINALCPRQKSRNDNIAARWVEIRNIRNATSPLQPALLWLSIVESPALCELETIPPICPPWEIGDFCECFEA